MKLVNKKINLCCFVVSIFVIESVFDEGNDKSLIPNFLVHSK